MRFHRHIAWLLAAMMAWSWGRGPRDAGALVVEGRSCHAEASEEVELLNDGLAGCLEGEARQKQRVGLSQAVGAGDQQGAQFAGLADVHQAIPIFSGFTNGEINANLAALLHRYEIGQQAAGHLDHLHDAGGDLSDADAVGFAAGQKDLDRFGGAAHASAGSGA